MKKQIAAGMIRVVVSVFVLGAFTMPPRSSAQQPKLTEFDPPNTIQASVPQCAPFCGTFAYSINDWGVVVGSYTDTDVVPHGFLRFPDGEFLSFDAPGAGLGQDLDEGTVPYAINDWGDVTGQYQDPNLLFHGFIRYHDGSYVNFEAPGVGENGIGTFGYSINNWGAVSGVYLDSNLAYHGFVRDPSGKITDFDVQGAGTGAFQGTYPCEETCINSWGEVAGFYYDGNNATHGFVREPGGKITMIDIPGAGTGAGQGTVVASINDAGTTTGYWADPNYFYYAFIRTRDGKVTTFYIPSANFPGQGTVGYSLNSGDAVAGAYFDANFAYQGFERFPCEKGNVVEFHAPHAGGGANQGTRASANNAWGTVAGWYIDQNNLNHGFVWYPGQEAFEDK